MNWMNMLERMSKAMKSNSLEEMESISMELHDLEGEEVEVPRGVEAYWSRMTVKILEHY